MHRGDDFRLDLVSDGSVILSGHEPTEEDDDVIEHLVFHPLRANSLAFIWLSGAWNHKALEYVCFVNDIPFAFKTSFGWSIIPKSQYAVGRLPGGFTSGYSIAQEVFMALSDGPPKQDGNA